MRRFLLLPLLAACGGAIGPIDPGTLHIEGSYDLIVGDFEAQPAQQGYPTPPTTGHPAIGQHARVDIRKNGSGYDAAVTPDFGASSPMTVSFGSDGTATLTGTVSFAMGSSQYASTSDTLTTLHLGVGADGHLSGAFTAEGNEGIFEGDVGWQADATASGKIGADARAPQARVAAAGTQSVVLPWDPLSVELSEPVNDGLASAISLTPGAASWQPAQPGVDWLGPTSLLGYRTSWSDFSGDATLAIAGGLADPSGNASDAAAAPVHFLDVPTASSFSGATPPAMWGAASVASGSASCGTAASCVEIGPLNGPCTAGDGGIAGRLPASGATQLSITYRVRTSSQYGSPYWPAGLGLYVATPGSGAQLASGAAFPTMNATNDPTYPYASDWTTSVVALPVTGNEIGFSLVPFGAMQSYCGGELGFPNATIVVDVAEVTVAP